MANVLPIITVPNPLLREKSKPVEQVDKKMTQLIADMATTLLKKDDPPGVGLSAVQVGKLWRIFILNMPPVLDLEVSDKKTPPSEVKVFINPEIVDKSEEMTFGPSKKNPIPEGCLSIPALYGPVPRHVWVTLKYQTFSLHPRGESAPISGVETRTDTFSNFYGRVVQHEYDHLDGILFTDYTLKHQEEIYFDQNDTLVPVPQPEKLIVW